MAEMKNKQLASNMWGEAERDSNLELFRIITMLLIVAHHYVTNSGLMNASGPIYSSQLNLKSLFFLLAGAWGKPGINCFVMITGYFMCKSKITARKFFKVFFEIIFYNIVISCMFWITGYSPVSIKSIIKSIFPVYSLSRNFTGCFLVFYLCIPFLNILIHHITEKQHQLLIALLGFMYVILGSNLFGNVEMNYVSWFTVVYLIASYIRLYPKPIFENRKLWGMISLGLVIVTLLSFLGIAFVSKELTGEMKSLYFLVTDSNYIVPLAFGISTFLFFKSSRVHYNKLINLIGASTFGVFCIHTNGDAMRKWLWGDLLKVVKTYGTRMAVPHLLLCVFIVFTVCTVIDITRRKIIEEPFFAKCMIVIDRRIGKKLEK